MRTSMKTSQVAVAAVAVAAVVFVACSSPSPAPAAPGTIIVGVEGAQVVGLVGSVHVTTRVDGVSTSDDTVDLLADTHALPKEVKLVGPAGKPGALVEVSVDGYAAGGGSAQTGATPIVTRRARSAFVPGATRLLRVTLENRCVAAPGGPEVCSAPQTCVARRCQSEDVGADQLEDYVPSWAVDAPDVCKPAGHGDPVVVVGTGQTDFLPITDGQTVQAEKGPQGGHHIWIAMRAKNLGQSGSTTTIRAVQPETGVAVPPTAFVFTLSTDEGGYCKLFGLRYQLDNGGIDYKQFLGKPLDVTVTVLDRAGAEASGVAHIVVAPTVIGE
jgi:hypothetical protein